MNYTVPNRKRFSELKNDEERSYFESQAASEAQRLLERINGSDEFKALVASNLGKIALAKLPKIERPTEPTQQSQPSEWSFGNENS